MRSFRGKDKYMPCHRCDDDSLKLKKQKRGFFYFVKVSAGRVDFRLTSALINERYYRTDVNNIAVLTGELFPLLTPLTDSFFVRVPRRLPDHGGHCRALSWQQMACFLEESLI